MSKNFLQPIQTSVACLAVFFAIPIDVHAQQAGDSPVKIFILAGQSNMEGQGEISPSSNPDTLENLVANDPAGDYQYLVNGNGGWEVRDDVWIRDESPAQGNLTTGWGATTTLIGPELAFGHFIGDLNEQQVLIVKAAWGGKSLGVDFRPPSSGWSQGAPVADGDEGFYYNEVLRLVNEATSNLATYFPDYDEGGFEIAGFCWHQGWNDRVDGGRSAEYEVNLANFINDIRSDANGLGIADLPFVIATTGMDGGPTYSVVEQAQLAAESLVNVSVIDTRNTYEGLEFWRPAELSPANQDFHWNRNARTYLHIGQAMADSMSILAPGRCPFRPRAEGAASGVTLSWENGTEIPSSVRILRNGIEVAAAAPATPSSFIDTSALPGALNYEIQFTMGGSPCAPLTVSFDGGITGLEAAPEAGAITLSWTNTMGYDGIQILRNGDVLKASLPGAATTYSDTSPPASGVVVYSVAPTTGTSTAATVEVNLNLVGELGILDPFEANGGINPATGAPWAEGDTYRLIFVTSSTTTATSTDIASYNAFVQGVAAAANLDVSGLGSVNWSAVGSTSAVDARDNLNANPTVNGVGEPILLMDGTTVIANGYADFWNGIKVTVVGSGDPAVDGARGIYFDENGEDFNAPPKSVDDRIFTGTLVDGTANSTQFLGALGNVATGSTGSTFPAQAWGLSGIESGRWTQDFNFDGQGQQEMYGMSDVLTILDTTPDTESPTLLSIVDGAGATSILARTSVSYTLTFSEPLDAATLGIDDFENAGSALTVINSVTATGNPAVFMVVATPEGPGDLQLAVATGALIEDAAGNSLDTGSALPDDTSITVIALPPVTGELGVLDVSSVNPTTGVAWAPGDTYRLVFVSSATTNATSTDISTYNAFIQGVADSAGLGNASWTAVGSTASVNAIDNTGTNPAVNGAGVPIVLMDGTTVIADDYADYWDGIVVTIIGGGDPTSDDARGIYFDENGNNFSPPGSADDRIYTGTIGVGVASGQPLGFVGNVSTGSTGSGFPAEFWGLNANGESSRWTEDFSVAGTTQQEMYGMSEILTVRSNVISGSFAAYMAAFPEVGEASGINDDPDGDGIVNGLEALFGTNPTEFSSGFTSITSDQTVTTFSHLANLEAPSDLSSFYEWSPNLIDWYRSNTGPVDGPTVGFVVNTSEGVSTITGIASEALGRVFFRVGVEED